MQKFVQYDHFGIFYRNLWGVFMSKMHKVLSCNLYFKGVYYAVEKWRKENVFKEHRTDQVKDL